MGMLGGDGGSGDRVEAMAMAIAVVIVMVMVSSWHGVGYQDTIEDQNNHSIPDINLIQGLSTCHIYEMAHQQKKRKIGELF